MSDIHNSVSAGASPETLLGMLPDFLVAFKGPTFKGGRRRSGEWEGVKGGKGNGRERAGEEKEGRERQGTPKGWFTPHVRNPENTLCPT